MNKSDQINELASALSKAQGVMGNVKKDKSNPFFNSSYADLAGAIDTAKEPLASNGLSVVQVPGAMTVDGTASLETVLLHSSGQWISETMQIRPVKNDPQGLGSALTYARRYAYMAVVGLASEDDDGNAASVVENKAKTIGGKVAVDPISSTATSEQVAKILAELERTKVEKEKIYKTFNVTDLTDLTKAEADKVIAKLVAKVVNS